MKKWWIFRHVLGGGWFADRAITIFGTPLCTMFFHARGPFPSGIEAMNAAIRLNARLSVSKEPHP